MFRGVVSVVVVAVVAGGVGVGVVVVGCCCWLLVVGCGCGCCCWIQYYARLVYISSLMHLLACIKEITSNRTHS